VAAPAELIMDLAPLYGPDGLEKLETQQSRPEFEPGEYRGLSDPETFSFDINASAKLYLLCPKCQPIRQWLQTEKLPRQLDPEILVSFEHHAITDNLQIII